MDISYDQLTPIISLLSAADFARAERLAAENGDPIDVVSTEHPVTELIAGLMDEGAALLAFEAA
jgi:hypothetical protein